MTMIMTYLAPIKTNPYNNLFRIEVALSHNIGDESFCVLDVDKINVHRNFLLLFIFANKLQIFNLEKGIKGVAQLL